ncbi:MAG: rod shape-determining protein RodA [Anaerolineae bacterium]
MRQRLWSNLDPWLMLATVALVIWGLAMVYSATGGSLPSDGPWWDTFFGRQVLYAAIGLLVLVLAAASDYRYLESLHRPLYALGLASLGLVFVVGQVAFGAQRWLDLRFFPLQPSELVKVFLIIGLAKLLADRRRAALGWGRLFLTLAYAAVPMAFIYLQPDLGTAVIFGAVWLAMVLASGARLPQFVSIASLAIALVPVTWPLLQGYMRERILVFLNPAHDPLGAGYNVNQARIAIGSGGLWGQGFASGSQSQLQFLRVRHTDFIFSVLGEELGFVGVTVLVVLLAVLLFRVLRVADQARDEFGRLIAAGTAAMIGFQAYANISMNLGLLPAVGMPLPFISYGGSALISALLGIGLVQSVAMRHRRLEF